MVSAVNFDYRGYDTLGASVSTAAAAAGALCLHRIELDRIVGASLNRGSVSRPALAEVLGKDGPVRFTSREVTPMSATPSPCEEHAAATPSIRTMLPGKGAA